MAEKYIAFLGFSQNSAQWLLLFIFLLAGLLLGRVIPSAFYIIKRRIRRTRYKNVFKKTARHLQKIGYGDIEENVNGRAHIKWNNRLGMSPLSLDFIAGKTDEIHGFLVKKGDEALPEHTSTRRELLEIFVNFDIDALYLINADTMVLSKVEFVLNQRNFTLPEEEGIKNWHWALIGLAFGYIFAKALSF